MRALTQQEAGLVSGGGKPGSCGCDPREKGNNGWGNGAEGTNPGSNKGGTAGSKSDELWTLGDGPRPAKHFER